MEAGRKQELTKGAPSEIYQIEVTYRDTFKPHIWLPVRKGPFRDLSEARTEKERLAKRFNREWRYRIVKMTVEEIIEEDE